MFPFQVFREFQPTLAGGFKNLGQVIRSLFANGEPGVWYDPSDLSTLCQDSAGTTPVTAVEQPVGLILDKSKGLVLGPELIPNGDFSSSTGWVLSAGVAISTGVCTFTNVGGINEGAIRLGLLTAGKRYRLTVDVLSISGGPIVGFFAGNISPEITTSGVYTFDVTAGSTTTNFGIIRRSGTVNAVIDNVSVKEIQGNHASQPTATSRPVLSARVNLLTKTEDFSDAVWLKAASGSGVLPTVSVDAGLSPIGTQTADLITINRGTTTGLSFLTQRVADNGVQKSRILYVKAFSASDVGKTLDTWTFDTAVANRFAITLTADWQKVALPNVTLSAGASRESIAFGYLDNGSLSPNTGEIKFYAWGADLRVANDGANLPPYQRVNTATDYDTVGFPHYLRFDGVDDWLVTTTITPGIDKVQVFAGARKLSDAAAAIAVELSGRATDNAGSFYITAPETTGVNGNYWFFSRGSAGVSLGQAARSTTLLAPRTDVITATGDISGDLSALRVNGEANGTNGTVDQGTGNYLAYPLYIGRRGGLSIPFNGHLYGLIVRFGANLPAATIQNTENYINTKTRAY